MISGNIKDVRDFHGELAKHPFSERALNGR
jgi:hypothetical protein